MASFQERTIAPIFVSRFNATGASIGANLAVTGSTTDDGVALPAAVDDPILGVTKTAIADQTWGDIQISGVAPVVNSGGVTKNDRLMINTSGQAVTYSAVAGTNKSLLGVALRTVATLALCEVLLSGPGASRQG